MKLASRNQIFHQSADNRGLPQTINNNESSYKRISNLNERSTQDPNAFDQSFDYMANDYIANEKSSVQVSKSFADVPGL